MKRIAVVILALCVLVAIGAAPVLAQETTADPAGKASPKTTKTHTRKKSARRSGRRSTHRRHAHHKAAQAKKAPEGSSPAATSAPAAASR